MLFKLIPNCKAMKTISYFKFEKNTAYLESLIPGQGHRTGSEGILKCPEQ